MLGKLLCKIGSHSRSGKVLARHSDGRWRSVCRHCGVRLVRDRDSGQWHDEATADDGSGDAA